MPARIVPCSVLPAAVKTHLRVRSACFRHPPFISNWERYSDLIHDVQHRYTYIHTHDCSLFVVPTLRTTVCEKFCKRAAVARLAPHAWLFTSTSLLTAAFSFMSVGRVRKKTWPYFFLKKAWPFSLARFMHHAHVSNGGW